MWQALLGKEAVPTVLVGHSMGGAVATWAASLQVCHCRTSHSYLRRPVSMPLMLPAACLARLRVRHGWKLSEACRTCKGVL